VIRFGDVLEGCPQLVTDHDDDDNDIYMSVFKDKNHWFFSGRVCWAYGPPFVAVIPQCHAYTL
jgi:hypothetical protein